jgi:hypothetical protein
MSSPLQHQDLFTPMGEPTAVGGAPRSALPPLLGEILAAQCGISLDAIGRGLERQREEGGLLGEVMLRHRLVEEDQLAKALAWQADMPYLDDLPAAEEIPAELIEKLPINFAKQRSIMPLYRDEAGRVVVAISDPTAVDVIDAVSVLLGEPVDPQVAAPGKILDHINRTYARLRGGAELEVSAKKDEDDEEFGGQAEELVDMLDANDERSEERRVGKECRRLCRSRWSPYH